MSIGRAIEQGVRQGLDKTFKPGGPFDALMGDVLKPLGDELRRLRRALAWKPGTVHPKSEGEVVIGEVKGDLLWVTWREPDGDDEGYWDRDIEHGDEIVEVTRWFRLPPSDNSILKPPADGVGRRGPASTTDAGKSPGTPNNPSESHSNDHR